MTAKRFTITQDFEEHHRQIRDNGHIIMGCFVEPQAEVIVNLLNKLSDENEQLKSECERAKTLRRIAYRNWGKVVEVIREEIKDTDNQEIKEFLVDLLNKELPDD